MTDLAARRGGKRVRHHKNGCQQERHREAEKGLPEERRGLNMEVKLRRISGQGPAHPPCKRRRRIHKLEHNLSVTTGATGGNARSE